MVAKDLILSIHLTLLCLQLRSLASFGQHVLIIPPKFHKLP